MHRIVADRCLTAIHNTGKLIPYASILDIVVSAAWSAEPAAKNGKLVVMGDGFVQIILK